MCWLRWAVVLTLIGSVFGSLICSVLHVPPAAPLAVVGNLVFLLYFPALRATAIVVMGAMIAPRARLATAIVLAAVHVPLSFWNHVLSRVSVDQLVLLEGPANYWQFALETLGAVLGVVYINFSEKANAAIAGTPAAKPVLCWLRWAVVVALVCSAFGEMVYSAVGASVNFAPGPGSGSGARAHRPIVLAFVQEWVGLLSFLTLRQMAFVVAGAIIAPRARRATAIVLAVVMASYSFWAHVL